MRILIIEDDKNLCKAVNTVLSAEGFLIDFCHEGDEGLALLCNNLYDACVLDRMLPVQDGLSILKAARKSSVATPVLMLTALGRVNDKVDCLLAGADDYLTKPFDMRELSARLHALMRRPADTHKQQLSCGSLVLYPSELLLQSGDKSVTLTQTECELLQTLIKHQGKLMHRSVLINRVWGANAQADEASLDSYICFVRRRLSQINAQAAIITVRGSGYRLEVTDGEKT